MEDYAFTIWDGGHREDGCDDVNSRIEDWVAKRVTTFARGNPVTKDVGAAIWLLTSNLLARSRRTRDKLKFGAQWAAYIAEDAKSILPGSLATAGDDINRAADLIYPLVAAKGTEMIALALREKGCDLYFAPADSVYFARHRSPRCFQPNDRTRSNRPLKAQAGEGPEDALVSSSQRHRGPSISDRHNRGTNLR